MPAEGFIACRLKPGVTICKVGAGGSYFTVETRGHVVESVRRYESDEDAAKVANAIADLLATVKF